MDKTSQMRSFVICTPHLYLLSNQIKKNEMGGACTMCGGQERCIQVLVGIPDGNRPLGRPKRYVGV